MLSPSVPELRVSIVENGDTVVLADVTVLKTGSRHEFERAGIEITFAHGQWVRTYPAVSDIDTIPPGKFDVSNVYTVGVDDESSRIFHERWVRDRFCPDPYFYEVADSRWAAEADAVRFRCRHFVLVGHDMWMEVLALELSWRLCEPTSRSIELG